MALSHPADYRFLTKVPPGRSVVSPQTAVFTTRGWGVGVGDLLQGSCVRCEGRDDAEVYKHVRSAMELFFSEGQRQDILALLAAILHLGNICFEGARSPTPPGI